MQRTLWAVAALGVAAAAACGDVVEIGASRDNTLYEDFRGAWSNGAGSYMFAGSTAGWAYRRALIAFDVAGSVPHGSTITGATLRLHMSKTIAGNQSISLHRLLSDWGEGSSNALGEEGDGAPSQPGDATWIHTFFDTQYWTTPGGDFLADPSAAAVVGGVGYYTWQSTTDLVADVQSWLDTPAQAFGWVILGNESTWTTAKRFDTREHSVIEFRPVLTIEYVPIPAPGGIALLGLGGLCLTRRRRMPAR